MSRPVRSALWACATLAALAAAALAGFVALRADAEPVAPDPAKISLIESLRFVASDDFNRMSPRRRIDFVDAAIARANRMGFEELFLLLTDADVAALRERAGRNARAIPGHQKVAGRLYGVLLDKFYALPPMRRKLYLTTLVLMLEG